MTHAQPNSDVDLSRARRLAEYVVGVANYTVGLLLTVGGLCLAVWWRARHGAINPLRAFYLYEGWCFGVLELVAATAMMRRWASRWILELVPLIVPIIAYQYFILHFIYRRV